MKKDANVVRGYQLHNGDVFTITTKRLFDVISHSNTYHIFLPIKRYKKVIWYKPSTWFRVLWDIEYLELEENKNDNI